MGRKLRIAIDCRIRDTQQGIGTAMLALAKALSESDVTDQEYTFIVHKHMQDWLAPYVYGPGKMADIPVSALSLLKSKLHKVGPVGFVLGRFRGTMKTIPVSDGYVESQQFDVVHFPTQAAYLTKIPFIYQPWDLQHLHYPQYFPKMEFDRRERCYPSFCKGASSVCVQAEWTKQDVIKQYGIAAEKIAVIPWGSVFDAYQAPSKEVTQATVQKHSLPEQFFLYPAVTWPHKNHEVIIRALHVLKSGHGKSPHVYFTGSSTPHRLVLEKLALDLGVFEQLHFLGFLVPEELQAIFSLATAMVFASRFEGFGLPILEAFQARLPVLSSNATTLPEVAQDGALYFDPDSPTELAALMNMLLDNPELRQDLIRKGTLLLSKFSINDTAASFQTLYERTAVLSSQTMQQTR